MLFICSPIICSSKYLAIYPSAPSVDDQSIHQSIYIPSNILFIQYHSFIIHSPIHSTSIHPFTIHLLYPIPNGHSNFIHHLVVGTYITRYTHFIIVLYLIPTGASKLFSKTPNENKDHKA